MYLIIVVLKYLCEMLEIELGLTACCLLSTRPEDALKAYCIFEALEILETH